MDRQQLERHLKSLPVALREEMIEMGQVKTIPAGTVILDEGAYVKVIPLVLRGSVRVFANFGAKELLLYYIEPSESCVMSFAAFREQSPSRIIAVTEKETEALLLPVQYIEDWLRRFPQLNALFFSYYDTRYRDLLDTIQHLLFSRLDERLMYYLRVKARVRSTSLLEIRHREIAAELGSAREVISRVLKKLEKEGIIRQPAPGLIEILEEK